MIELLREIVSLALLLVPAAYAWRESVGIVGRVDDPAFAELRAAFHHRLGVIAGVCVMLAVVVSATLLSLKVAITFTVILAALYRIRRVVFNERWTFFQYLRFTLGFWFAALGVWVLLAIVPGVMTVAGQAALPAGVALGLAMLIWIHTSPLVFAKLVGARPAQQGDLTERLDELSARARCRAPAVLTCAAPGGFWVNAFALPSHYQPAVLLTRDLMESLTGDETAAIFAHELAHLEHYTRRRLIVRDLALLLLIGGAIALLFWLGPQTEIGRLIGLAWPVLCLLALLILASKNQTHEHASDLRALELIGDPDALIRALTKIHELMRVPRRWGKRAEHQQTHPSLARRIRAIRDAATSRGQKVEGPAVTEIAVRSIADPHEAVVMAADRLHWLRGIAAEGELDPGTVWRTARDCRSIRYSQLADLRLEVGRGARRWLVATDPKGYSLTLPLPADAVAAVKANLERIELEVQDTSRTASDRRRLELSLDRKNRFWGAIALFTALLPPQSLPLFAAAGLVLLRPARVILWTAGIVGTGPALLGLRTSHVLWFDGQIKLLLIGLKVAVALALVGAALERKRKHLTDPPWAWKATLAALAALAVLYGLRGVGLIRSPLPIMELHLWARYEVGLALVLLGTATVLFVSRRTPSHLPAAVALGGAALLLVTGTLWFRDHFGDDPLVRRQAMLPVEQVHLRPWRSVEVPMRVGDVRLSPTGRRIAMRVTYDEYPGQFATAPNEFAIETEHGTLVRTEAWDVRFLTDDILAVLAERDGALVLERLRVWPESSLVDREPLPRLKLPTLRVNVGRRSWEVVSTDFGTSQSVRLTGVFGTNGFTEHRWAFEEPRDLFLDALIANAGPEALVVASRFTFSLFDRIPLFLPPLAGYSTLSQIAVLEGSASVALALTTLDIWCLDPIAGQEHFICVGNDREATTWIWAIHAAQRTLKLRAVLADYYFAGKLTGDDELLLQGVKAPLSVHLGEGRAVTFRAPEESIAQPFVAQPTTAFARPRSVSLTGHNWETPVLAAAKQREVVALAVARGAGSVVTVYHTKRDHVVTQTGDAVVPAFDSSQTSHFPRVARRR